MKRPAVNRYRLSEIARAWKVSERAVLEAAAVLGYRFLAGGLIYATKPELDPGSPFQLEASLIEKMRKGRQ